MRLWQKDTLFKCRNVLRKNEKRNGRLNEGAKKRYKKDKAVYIYIYIQDKKR